MTKITIGARGKLSLAYVEKVKELLKNNKDIKEENIEFKATKTSGDINSNKKISEMVEKICFVRKLKRA